MLLFTVIPLHHQTTAIMGLCCGPFTTHVHIGNCKHVFCAGVLGASQIPPSAVVFFAFFTLMIARMLK